MKFFFSKISTRITIYVTQFTGKLRKFDIYARTRGNNNNSIICAARIEFPNVSDTKLIAAYLMGKFFRWYIPFIKILALWKIKWEINIEKIYSRIARLSDSYLLSLCSLIRGY